MLAWLCKYVACWVSIDVDEITVKDLSTLLAELGPEFFKAFSDPTRINILLALAEQQGSCAVSGIAEHCTVDLSVVSRHLSQLKRAGIVDAEKIGREVYYQFSTQNVVQALRACADALEICCPSDNGDQQIKGGVKPRCC